MQLKPEQLARLRKPFDAVGAFENKKQEEVVQILNGVMAYYLTLARIHIRNKNRQADGNKSTHNK
jgi:hypothetical protein